MGGTLVESDDVAEKKRGGEMSDDEGSISTNRRTMLEARRRESLGWKTRERLES